MLKCLFLIILIANIGSTYAQPPKSYTTKKTAKGKVKKYFDQGMALNLKNENEGAIKEFEKALKQDPTFIDAQLQWAAVQYVMNHFEAAEEGFEKVLRIDPAYNTKVIYTLALSEMKLNKYKEAAVHFQQYLDTNPRNSSLLEKAQRNFRKATFMHEALANPVPFEPVNLGPNINTKEDWEYFPSLTADEKTLVFTVYKDDWEDFYMSQKVDGIWQKAKPMDDINTPLNEGAQSISADGKLLVYTGCDRKDGYGKCDLYFSEVRKGRWTKAQNMGKIINSAASEKQPTVSADGRTLYFASDRSGGQGKSDIWVSYRDKSGKWSKPENLGTPINTPLEENFPFIHQDGRTLYFASDGHPGMGRYDLFVVRKGDEDNWQEPVNLGYPINTQNDETSFIVSLDGRTAYFASDRDNKNTSASPTNQRIPTDIYSFELYSAARPLPVTYVKARVIDRLTRKNLEAEVDFVNLNDGKIYATSKTDKDGEFLICLPTGKDYALNVSKEKYTFHSEHFALSQKSSIEKPHLLEISLQPIPEMLLVNDSATITKPTILKNVFFDTGSAELREASFFELDYLKQMLTDNKGIHIRIDGHTDNIGEVDDNLKLSEQRAKAVYDYLIKAGISATRLQFKGFGESTPIADNQTEINRQKNRRTEFVIIANTMAPSKNP